ncbi:S1C family serine protease [Patescibacteria group bacterium]|nr:PDZ domain-containing protein [Candidatus Falkowbacteria bacterium]MBU3905778.1 S1C family serine protease [Patescibacteria group bacterium]MCG2697532.1 S1C family serine protease [Candidatus Parcubacteria bacterium]MBU4014916.1 S1C family serine protease [Patescibacteria group bacterium]MBU4026116.1 S1C family serine protease [Patescibacteria group bacterium]
MQNKIKQENKKNSAMLIIVLAVIFGLLSGMAGGLAGRSFFDFYYLPFFGEINFSDMDYKGSNLIIRDAKKVIVEQDTKTIEAINSAKASMVGIFKKSPQSLSPAKNDNKFNLDDYYQPNQLAGQGLAITSDGWIAAVLFKDYKLPLTEEIKQEITANYAAIDQNENIYEIGNIVFDSLTGFSFIHISSKDMPVKKFADLSEIKNGQLAATVNWDDQVWTTVIADKKSRAEGVINFSDSFSDRIELAGLPEEKFKGSALFNLAGDIVGLIDNKNEVIPINHFTSAINSLLKNKEIKRASMGVNYVELSDLIKAAPDLDNSDMISAGAIIHKDSNGVSIIKNSAAESAGLKEGDIITAAGNININKDNSLAEAMHGFAAREKIKLTYFREGKKYEVEVELGELK